MIRTANAVVVVAALIALVVAGCGGGTSTPRPPTGTGALQGTVVQANDITRPINGAQITLDPHGLSATADAAGSFRIQNIAPGDYTVIVTSPLNAGFQAGTLSLRIANNQTVNVTVALLPAAAGSPTNIAINPTSPTVEVGGKVNFRALITGTSGIIDVAPTWIVTGAAGTIAPDGVFTATAAGMATVTAVSGGVSNATQVTVTPPDAPRITEAIVSPLTLPASGGQVQITATVTDGQGVAEVAAEIFLPGDPTPIARLMPLDAGDEFAGTYRRVYDVPANSNPPDALGNQDPQTYSVRVRARDTDGRTRRSDLQDFVVEGVVAPPPPPGP